MSGTVEDHYADFDLRAGFLQFIKQLDCVVNGFLEIGICRLIQSEYDIRLQSLFGCRQNSRQENGSPESPYLV